MNTLSTTEKIVGYDVDGSTIYEKSFYSDSVSLTSATIIDSTLTYSATTRIISFNSVCYMTGAINAWNGPYLNGSAVAIPVVDSRGLVLSIANVTVTKYHITVRYVKS